MGLRTTAVLSEDGKEWIVNGKYYHAQVNGCLNLVQAARNGLPMAPSRIISPPVSGQRSVLKTPFEHIVTSL